MIPTPKPKPRPRPSRTALDEAERAVAQAEEAYATERGSLADREKQLARDRRTLDDAYAGEAARLREAQDTAQRAYDHAMAEWRR